VRVCMCVAPSSSKPDVCSGCMCVRVCVCIGVRASVARRCRVCATGACVSVRASVARVTLVAVLLRGAGPKVRRATDGECQ
jgi:hypothetical protein